MEYTIYYTFSTIPQVLAGAIALLGVFLIFKLQIVNRELIGFGEHMKIELETANIVKAVENGNKRFYTRLKKAIARQDLKDVKVQIDNIADFLKTESMREFQKNFEIKNINKEHLIKKTQKAVIVSAIVISLSVGILPFTKFIALCLCLSVLIYLLIIPAFIFCLYLMVRVIYKALAI